MVALEQLDDSDKATLRTMIESHEEYTGSDRAKMILINWNMYADRFVKVMPMDYKRVLQSLERARAAGLSGDEAMNAAFEENSHNAARLGGS
jgi:glutamate synthase (ferredoxin)